MSTNRVSATLSAANNEAIFNAIDEIRANMPFLVDLSVEERKRLAKMGDRSLGFLNDAHMMALQNPDMLPRSFGVDEMTLDVNLFRDLHPILMAINQLRELIEDTYMAVGAEAYKEALAVYAYAKVSDTGMGLDTSVKDLSRRFARKSRSGDPAGDDLDDLNEAVGEEPA
jgi:hypothetical protein